MRFIEGWLLRILRSHIQYNPTDGSMLRKSIFNMWSTFISVFEAQWTSMMPCIQCEQKYIDYVSAPMVICDISKMLTVAPC